MVLNPYTIYLITNTINDKKYVGYTKRIITHRLCEHINDKSNRALSCAIRKYGPNAFGIRAISTVPDHETAKWMERRLVVMFNAFDKGYNMTPGGDGYGGGPHSEEHKRRISISLKGRKRPDQAIRNKCRDYKTKPPWTKGRSPSEETRRKLKEASLRWWSKKKELDYAQVPEKAGNS